ncbi:acetoacetate decarboxylase [Grosmannia clavigera kw1407]|uniref:Acetoacetate decarboxylase n=1 Tax=Grosmannia clavigera (strain kw1407 / UAMH 11150) TaxID=655863 RepID=F0X6N8_GROCL|nr:acetoacetate decarboxylase [Grosmannia clavigera kw1407]EFX06465.1 acetoacetate decarboxylase [Grosmannia clavigera kw1407]
MPFGHIKTKEVNHGIPIHSPPYPHTADEFSDIDCLSISYFTKADALAPMIPEELEIDDEPLVILNLFKYGTTPIGAYTEFVQQVEVRWEGKKYLWTMELILDNQGAIFSGREKYGIPKVFGNVVWDPSSTKGVPSGFYTGYVERPVGAKIVQLGFKPQKKVHGLQTLPDSDQMSLHLRSIPSANPGQPPVVREFVPLKFRLTEAEVWTGIPSVGFTGMSDFDPVHKLPVIRYGSATLFRHASAVLDPCLQTYAI